MCQSEPGAAVSLDPEQDPALSPGEEEAQPEPGAGDQEPGAACTWATWSTWPGQEGEEEV